MKETPFKGPLLQVLLSPLIFDIVECEALLCNALRLSEYILQTLSGNLFNLFRGVTMHQLHQSNACEICLHLFVKLYNTGHQTGHLSHCAVSIAELILVCGFPSTAGNNKQSPHVVFFTQITKLHCNPPQHVFFIENCL